MSPNLPRRLWPTATVARDRVKALCGRRRLPTGTEICCADAVCPAWPPASVPASSQRESLRPTSHGSRVRRHGSAGRVYCRHTAPRPQCSVVTSIFVCVQLDVKPEMEFFFFSGDNAFFKKKYLFFKEENTQSLFVFRILSGKMWRICALIIQCGSKRQWRILLLKWCLPKDSWHCHFILKGDSSASFYKEKKKSEIKFCFGGKTFKCKQYIHTFTFIF